MRWIGGLLLALCLAGAAQAQQVNLYCNNGATGPSAWQPCVSGNPLAVNASVSASVAGFTPSTSGARATPLTVTTADSSGTLPTGAVVIVSNVGSNPMYCNVNGAAATTSDQPIASGVGNWFAFTIPVGVTTLHCIATGGSTTANMLGGSGLATGSGGGGGGAASTVTANQGTANATPWNENLAQIGGSAVGSGNPLFVSVTNSNANGQATMQNSSPVVLASNQSVADPCVFQAKTNLPISFQTTSITQLIALSGSTKIYVCSLSLIASVATVFSITGGTGTNCGTPAALIGTTSASNGLSLAANGGLTLGNGGGTVAVTGAGSELCIVQSGAGNLVGNLTYVQQ